MISGARHRHRRATCLARDERYLFDDRHGTKGATLKETELCFRQIHLDFHTSESIESGGSDFDSDEFIETLLKANVNSINFFARCHPGWLYFDSKAFPERRHPHLQKGLLSRQMEACHRRGIRVRADRNASSSGRLVRHGVQRVFPGCQKRPSCRIVSGWFCRKAKATGGAGA